MEIEDTQCGFKCFTERAAEDVFPKITISRFGFDPEALVIAEKLGYKIKEIPIVWINDVESKVKFKNIIEMFFETIKIRINLILGKYGKKEEVEKPLFRKIDIYISFNYRRGFSLAAFGNFQKYPFNF